MVIWDIPVVAIMGRILCPTELAIHKPFVWMLDEYFIP